MPHFFFCIYEIFKTRTMTKKSTKQLDMNLDLIAQANTLVMHDQSIPQIQNQLENIANTAGFR